MTEGEQLNTLSTGDGPQTQLGHGRQGTHTFEDTMLRAPSQADYYARAISKEDGRLREPMKENGLGIATGTVGLVRIDRACFDGA